MKDMEKLIVLRSQLQDEIELLNSKIDQLNGKALIGATIYQGFTLDPLKDERDQCRRVEALIARGV